MKKIATILCILLWTAPLAGRERDRCDSVEREVPSRRLSLTGVEFRNLSFSRQKIDLAGENTLSFAPTLRGVAFTSGHTFLVHERSLLKIVNFGFDVIWSDVEYGYWRERVGEYRKWMHKLDIGLGIGPAIHINPVDRLRIHAYFRYTPTMSLVTHNFAGDEEGKFELVVGLPSYFSAGVAVSWSAFSLGAEYRYGSGTYRGIKIPDVTISLREIDELLGFDIKDTLDHQRHTMRGWRFYLGFRF